MNTMLNGMNQDLIKQIQAFAEKIRQSGQNPEDILNREINSGKYSKQQIEWAKNMAKMFAGKQK